MPAALPIIAIVVAAASTAYSAYTQNDNAIDARKEADKQKQAADERARAQAAQDKERAALENSKLQSQQRAALAASGVDLNAEDLAKLTTDETAALGAKDQNTIGENLRMRLEDNQFAYNNKTQGLPSTGSIIGGSALSFASSALSTYSGYQNSQAMLSRTQSLNSGNMYTANSSGYSLMGGRKY